MDKRILYGALALGLLLLMKKDTNQPRGIRNNNPLNIRKSNDNWQGAIGDDGAFTVFDSPLMGIRAGAKVLKTYREKYGLLNVTDILMRFAPPSENDTTSYIDSVSAKVGVGRYENLLRSDYPQLVAAMIYHENGMQPYDKELINDAVNLAFA